MSEVVEKEVPAEITTLMRKVIKRTWSEYKCLRGPRPSGALISVNDTMVYGFVKPSVGMPSCKDEGECMMEDGHCVRNLHAEVDAILRASRLGFTLHGADMYSINKPCYNCTLHIIDSGIDRIFYAYAVYDEDRTTRALDVARIECIHVPVD